MSEFGSDIDDELLELAGASEKKRKRKAGASKSQKRRKDINMDSDEPDEPESEDEDDQDPYPLDGQYADEKDRAMLMDMNEFEREAILAQRLEEKQRLADKRNLDQMLQDQNKRGGVTGADADSVSKAAKRQHMAKGSTKEKVGKLAELKAKRKAKDENSKRTRASSPKRERSNSPGTDMEMSSDEEEDGQISKLEQEYEKDDEILRSMMKPNPEMEPITVEDLDRCRITRDALAKYCLAPWFEDYVKGGWVRYLIGHNKEKKEDVYRICEIINLGADLVKPYKVNDKTVNQAIELRHGAAVKTFNMDKVSNSPFTANEFERLETTCRQEKVKLPMKRQCEKKKEQIQKLASQPMTESDISAMLARKNGIQATQQSAVSMTMERSRLTQARTLALRRQDNVEVAEIDMKLQDLAATVEAHSGGSRAVRNSDTSDLLAKVNERNRLANKEAVRKAELMEAERRRRDRKLAATGATAHLDPSARLRIAPRTFTPSTRPGTPSVPAAAVDTPLPPSALSGLTRPACSFEAQMDVEVDLGDF